MTAPNWIIPARRVVIRGSISYSDLIDAWLQQLKDCRAVLKGWYGIDNDAQFDSGLEMIEFWKLSFFPDRQEIHAVRDGEVTIDSPPFHLRVRLWKGPLRVVLEAEHHKRLIGPKWHDGEQIADTMTLPWPDPSSRDAQPPRLMLGEGRQVTNADAEFLVGDVVEFPLWKFLAGCGLSAFGTDKSFEDVMRFNPEGHYLLGTSVKDSGGNSPPKFPVLHDNRIAMRFQLALGAFRAAFYHLDEPVYDKASWYKSGKAVMAVDSVPLATRVHVESGSAPSRRTHTVFARGMMYAATLYPLRWKKKDSLRLFTSAWCHDAYRKIPRNLPTRASLDLIPKTQPMTPGGVCSDTLLWLFNYMIRVDQVSGGKSSVSETMKSKMTFPIQSHYEYVPASEIEKLAPEISAAEKIADLEAFALVLESTRDLVTGATAFWVRDFNDLSSLPEWTAHVSARHQSRLEDFLMKSWKGNRPPSVLMRRLQRAIKRRKTSSKERKALMEFHSRFAQGVSDFADVLDNLMSMKEWKTFESEGPDFSKLESDIAAVRASSCVATTKCVELHAAAEIGRIALALDRKLKAINKLVADPSKIKATRGGKVDMSPHLSDVNTVSLNGHEWGVVRIKPFDRLLKSEDLPVAGYIAAFEPLSGLDCCPAGAPESGQFFIFEESGSALKKGILGPHGKEHALMGCTPFNWYPVPGNEFNIEPHGKGIRFTNAGHSSRKRLLRSITRLKQVEPGKDPLIPIQEQDPQAYLPLFVHTRLKWWDSEGGKRANARLVKNGADMYAARALPFPTLNEMRGILPNAEDVYPYLDALDV